MQTLIGGLNLAQLQHGSQLVSLALGFQASGFQVLVPGMVCAGRREESTIARAASPG